MKILIVTNPETCGDTIHVYTARCTDSMLFDVETAFEELGIEVPTSTVEEISNEMLHGRNYWFNETYCFEVIPV